MNLRKIVLDMFTRHPDKPDGNTEQNRKVESALQASRRTRDVAHRTIDRARATADAYEAADVAMGARGK